MELALSAARPQQAASLLEKWVFYMNPAQLLRVWIQEERTERTVGFPTELSARQQDLCLS